MDTIKRLLDMERIVDGAGIAQPSTDERLRFGDVAVAIGYVTQTEVHAALALQRLDRAASKPHRRIGEILVSVGALDARQVSEVLDALVKAAHQRRTRRVGERRLDWQPDLVGPLCA